MHLGWVNWRISIPKNHQRRETLTHSLTRPSSLNALSASNSNNIFFIARHVIFFFANVSLSPLLLLLRSRPTPSLFGQIYLPHPTPPHRPSTAPVQHDEQPPPPPLDTSSASSRSLAHPRGRNPDEAGPVEAERYARAVMSKYGSQPHHQVSMVPRENSEME